MLEVHVPGRVWRFKSSRRTNRQFTPENLGDSAATADSGAQEVSHHAASINLCVDALIVETKSSPETDDLASVLAKRAKVGQQLGIDRR
jgi:hypothetical protein